MQPQGRGSRDPPSSLCHTPLHAIHAVIRISNPILEITTAHTKFCPNLHKNVPHACLRGQRENNHSYRQQKMATLKWRLLYLWMCLVGAVKFLEAQQLFRLYLVISVQSWTN
jgi:hypothetical protein